MSCPAFLFRKREALAKETDFVLGSFTPAAGHPRSLAVKAEGKGLSFPRAGGVWSPPFGKDCPKLKILASCSLAFGLAFQAGTLLRLESEKKDSL